MQGGQQQGPTPPAPLPGWLGPVVTLTTQVGVPTVIAGVLLYFVLFRLDTTLKIIESTEGDRVKIISAMQDTLVAALDKSADRFEKAMQANMALNRDLYEASRRERDNIAEKLRSLGKESYTPPQQPRPGPQ
jgi:hypothetical protein